MADGVFAKHFVKALRQGPAEADKFLRQVMVSAHHSTVARSAGLDSLTVSCVMGRVGDPEKKDPHLRDVGRDVARANVSEVLADIVPERLNAAGVQREGGVANLSLRDRLVLELVEQERVDARRAGEYGGSAVRSTKMRDDPVFRQVRRECIAESLSIPADGPEVEKIERLWAERRELAADELRGAAGAESVCLRPAGESS